MPTSDGIRSDIEVAALLESPTAVSLDANTTLAGAREKKKLEVKLCEISL